MCIDFLSEIIEEKVNQIDLSSFLKLNEMGQPIVMCSFCNLIRVGRDFCEIEEAGRRGLFAQHFRYTRVFTVCDVCKEGISLRRPEQPNKNTSSE